MQTPRTGAETLRRRLALTALTLVLVLAGCSVGATPEASASASKEPAAHAHAGHGAESEAPPVITGASLYNLESRWHDQHGAERRLASLAGRVQLVSMVYTNCAHTCPKVLADLRRIEAELGPEAEGRLGFVLVSIDPERDTPEQLGKFATGARLEPEKWTLLNGDDGSIREVAAVLGVQYRADGASDFAHTNVIAVLDRSGEVVHRRTGLGGDPAETVAVVRGLLAGE